MKWEAPSYNAREFDKNCACDGDIYLYKGGKLLHIANGLMCQETKTSLFKKLKHYLFCKKNGIVINLNRRTLAYIYRVCKGVMPPSEEEFAKCVLSSINKEKHYDDK